MGAKQREKREYMRLGGEGRAEEGDGEDRKEGEGRG